MPPPPVGPAGPGQERVCSLLVLDSVTSTTQWIRQLKPRDDVHDVYVFVCKCVLGSSRASGAFLVDVIAAAICRGIVLLFLLPTASMQAL